MSYSKANLAKNNVKPKKCHGLHSWKTFNIQCQKVKNSHDNDKKRKKSPKPTENLLGFVK